MFKSIMIPVDISHVDTLRRALDVGSDLGKHYGAGVTVVGVTTAAPAASAHSPEELEQKLEALAKDLSGAHGIEARAKTVVSHDPTIDMEDKLVDAAKDLGADLVVMASHKPGLLEHIISAHAVDFAAHTDMSVFIVR
ncbi:MAG: universal stress protein [Rhodospirillales bacterium]|nr:universal stress protein [Rhodospirillales bacterium]MBO6785258.1 universal stress protein [Rhodospirillales bacterium]